MKLAIIGTGISGLTAAHLLAGEHDLTLYEANDYVGGHTHTIDVDAGGDSWPVDTGFIVFNDRTYPNLLQLFRSIGVQWQPSTMAFSVRCERTGLEYCPSSLNTLFAQRRNLFRPSFWRMIRGILRFRRESQELLNAEMDLTLGEYLDSRQYPREFIEHFIVPMGAAVWSAAPVGFRQFPARLFVEFFTNHGALQLRGQPQWRVVRGGSREYVRKLIAPFRNRIRLQCPVTSVRRIEDGVIVTAPEGPERYDEVIIAAHSDEALAMLADPTPAERAILAAIPYQPNEVTLHTDKSLLPRCPRAVGSWNYHLPAERGDRVTLTYYMNMLQSLEAKVDFCVTLNATDRIDPSTVIASMVYSHPVYTPNAPPAQSRHREISGQNRTHYAGAYWGYGFHEDGVRSALAVCRRFGKAL
jgi:uncharacterized protein